MEDLIELRKLRKARHGIDVAKLNNGEVKKRKKRPREEGEQGGLRKGVANEDDEYVQRFSRSFILLLGYFLEREKIKMPRLGELSGRITLRSRRMLWMLTSICGSI